jgi:Icc protein
MKRTDFLNHVAWTGAGVVYTVTAAGLAVPALADSAVPGIGRRLSFVQVSDSHLGFTGTANHDVTGTLAKAVDAINALPDQPAFVIHTGDITHLSKAAQFDTARQILGSLRAPLVTIPGEHDTIGTPSGKQYLEAFGSRNRRDGMNDSGKGWYSWDQGGAHFIALVNVFAFEAMGLLGQEQIDWLTKDLASQKSDTPIVVFSHVPLYALYPAWGWTTDDGSKALALLSRFDAATVLNGHIHQIIEHSEGNIRFHTASPTAYPLPAPGSAPKPGPVTVPPGELLGMLGFRSVTLTNRDVAIAQHPLA